ncbi:MAG: glutamate-5-semialdehyde dehydrogenase [Rhodospirillaceae bacterium]|jgi:glutamate-5-semialdehyde dehydrogenase|nr:glutamate-5-semialdehyde dehydrogenase [Rhodospirillaceae bacterium]
MNAATQATAQRQDDVVSLMDEIGRAAREAAGTLALASNHSKNQALLAAAAALREATSALLEANAHDMALAREKGLSGPILDRLALDTSRIESMATGLEAIAELDDPVGRERERWTVPSGLDIARVSVPLGVIGIIYESRPNVTADAGALCLKSGNAAILRGGSESHHSSHAIAACLQQGLATAGLPEAAIQLVPTTDRAAVGAMLTMTRWIDIIVPRGGQSLIERVQSESRVPVIAHLIGLCHVYVDGKADAAMARDITVNAKMRRTSICGAAETLLLDEALAPEAQTSIVSALVDAGCEVRGDEAVQKLDPRVGPAGDIDWDTEYLDSVISARIVDGVEGALDHIGRHGSDHTDTIVTQDDKTAELFLTRAPSAIAMWNASTQFADGGEFGMGVEIGISTNRLHARGPVGVDQLTTMKYVVRGSGQIRP